MYERYHDRAGFLTIYIKEAHPEDEWQLYPNEKEGVCYRQPRSLSDRVVIAKDFVQRLHYRIPIVVDRMDNQANELYAGWPERLYIIGEAGQIVYKGAPGPFGYHPEEAAAWLAKRFGSASETE